MKIVCTLLCVLAIHDVYAQQDTIPVNRLQDVVVTGQYSPQTLKNSVYQIRVIGRELIRQSGATTVQQVLNTQTGFRFSNDNTLGTADVELMGMSGRNVKILMDGVPLADRGDTRESLAQIDVNSIDRIEVVNGPMSVSYGSDALAGVINIITRKNTTKGLGVFAKAQEESAGKEYHPFSYRGSHQQLLNVNWGNGIWNISAGGTHNEFNGFGGDVYGRNKSWKPKEQWMQNARLGYAKNGFSMYYRIDGLQETITNRGAINASLYKATDQKYITGRYLHQLQSAWHVNDRMQINSLLAFTDLTRKTVTTSHDFTKGTDALTTGAGEQDISRLNNLDFRSTLQYKASSICSLQPGIEINREQASGARITGNPVITDYALFVSSEIQPVPGINIRPGLRFIKNSVYDAPPVIPSINTKFALSSTLSLRLAYAYGFRAPALRELYFTFHDANHDIIGNPDLKAERSNSFTGSVSYVPVSKGSFTFSSTLEGFYNQFNNLISYAQSTANPSQYVTVNIDQFRTTGLTLENKASFKNIDATLAFAYIGRYNSFSDDASYKARSLPTFVWTPELSLNILYRLPKAGTSFGLFYKFNGRRPGYEQYTNTTTSQEDVRLTKIASFHWVDFTVSQPLFTYLTLSAGVRNIFDVTSLANTSTDAGGAHSSGGPQPMGYGRSYFAGLAFQLNRK